MVLHTLLPLPLTGTLTNVASREHSRQPPSRRKHPIASPGCSLVESLLPLTGTLTSGLVWEPRQALTGSPVHRSERRWVARLSTPERSWCDAGRSDTGTPPGPSVRPSCRGAPTRRPRRALVATWAPTPDDPRGRRGGRRIDADRLASPQQPPRCRAGHVRPGAAHHRRGRLLAQHAGAWSDAGPQSRPRCGRVRARLLRTIEGADGHRPAGCRDGLRDLAEPHPRTRDRRPQLRPERPCRSPGRRRHLGHPAGRRQPGLVTPARTAPARACRARRRHGRRGLTALDRHRQPGDRPARHRASAGRGRQAHRPHHRPTELVGGTRASRGVAPDDRRERLPGCSRTRLRG